MINSLPKKKPGPKIGSKQSESHRNNIRQAKKGKRQSLKQRRAIGAGKKGKAQSCLHRNNISVGLTRTYKNNPALRKKKSVAKKAWWDEIKKKVK